MGKKDDIITLRNEGMAYALAIAKKDGVEELERQVKIRGAAKVSLRFTKEELRESMRTMSERIYANQLTLWYAVFHDKMGFGKDRMQRLKRWYDEKLALVAGKDPMGEHWARFEDYAEEANKLHGLGIDMDAIIGTQNDVDRDGGAKTVEAWAAVCWLRDRGHAKAADALEGELFGKGRKMGGAA